jgi:hypothetical protein
MILDSDQGEVTRHGSFMYNSIRIGYSSTLSRLKVFLEGRTLIHQAYWLIKGKHFSFPTAT